MSGVADTPVAEYVGGGRAAAWRWGSTHGLGEPWARWALGLAALAALPLLSQDDQVLTYADLFLIDAIAVIGLTLAQGRAGIINLGAGAAMGVGAYASAAAAHHWHLPMPLPLLAALAVAPLAAVVVGGPALVLSRLHFAMISFYAALLVPVVAAQGGTFTGGSNGLTDLEPLEIAGYRPVGAPLYGVLAGLVVIAYAVAATVAQGRWGRAFVAVREDETAAAALGISVHGAKLLASAIAAVFGAVAGALFVSAWPGNCPSGYAGATCVIAPGYFGLDLSILLFAAVVIGGAGSRVGPLAGVALLVAMRWYFDTQNGPSGDWQTVIYGCLLIAVTVALPRGLGGLGGFFTVPRAVSAPAVVTPPPALPPRRRPGMRLAASGLRVAFGGVVVLDGVDLAVEPGQIHALVGPNGSGKTTLLNCIAALVRPAAGEVSLGGDVLPPLPARLAHRRARLGLTRSFQTPRLQPQLSALENVEQGLFVGPRTSPAAAALAMLRAVGLEHRAHVLADNLPHGERRLVEVARALVAEPVAVLLDEPAAGLDPAARQRLVAALRATREWGVAVVLVEHDLDLVLEVADLVTVLEGGRAIATGVPEAVRADPAVARAFMGPLR